jgi:hypothetical protein
MTLAHWQNYIQDNTGNVLSGASVTVRREISGGPLATLYTDRAGTTPAGNPVTSNSSGYAEFYVEAGEYRIQVASGSYSSDFRYVAIGIAADLVDLADAALTGIVVRTDVGTLTARAITALIDGGIAVTEGDGINGNPVLELGDYLPSWTGGVSRTVTGKFHDYATFQDFGCSVDGVTNDTANAATAIAYCQANSIPLILTGTLFVDNISIPHDTTWDSISPWNSHMLNIVGLPGATIKKRSSTDNSHLIASSRWVDNVLYASSPVRFENIVFDANSIAANAFQDQSFGSEYVGCVFKNATWYGYCQSVSTKDTTILLGNRQNNKHIRNRYVDNGHSGFYVDAVSGAAIISDNWLVDCLLYDNGETNAYIGQCYGWIIRGNHAYFAGVTPSGETASIIINDPYATIISGNIWEGYSTTYYGLRTVGGGDPFFINGDRFETGLGLSATFGSATTKLVHVSNCVFQDTTTLNHACDDATCELVSSNNYFENTDPYTFSAGDTHDGITRSVNDRIAANQWIYEGRQDNSVLSVRAVDGVTYPGSFPYTLGITDYRCIRVTSALGADIVIKMPNVAFRGLSYHIIRTSTATGAYNIKIQTYGSSDIVYLGSASTFATVMHDGSAWIVTAQGAV